MKTRRRLLSLLLLVVAACGAQFGARREIPLPYRQAQDAFRLGDYDRAVRGYSVFLSGDEREDLIPRAFYKMALAQYRRGAYADAAKTLEALQRRYPDAAWSEAYELRGDIAQRRGNAVSAIHWWEQSWEIADEARRRRLVGRIRAVARGMSPTALASAASVVRTPEVRAALTSRLRAGDRAGTAPDSSVPASGVVLSEVAPLASDRLIQRPRIGCLLPLSGPYASYGQRSLNGIRLALGQRVADVVLHDDVGEPQRAITALNALAADPSVIAVLGPLRSRVAARVAPRAAGVGMPLIVLAQRRVAGTDVVSLSLGPRLQAVGLAEYVTRSMGLSRMAVIHPNTTYGTAVARAFETEVKRRGGTMVGVLAYSPGARSFALEAATAQRWKEQAGVQAIFLPDYLDTAAVVAAELRRVVPGVLFLGGSGWNDLEKLVAAGDVLEGSVFVDGFFAGSSRTATRAFVTAYRRAYGADPTILEAQAYDAATLIRMAIDAGGRSRSDFLARLSDLGTVQGATGPIAVRPGGVQRSVFLLQFSGGVIHELSALPAEAARSLP